VPIDDSAPLELPGEIRRADYAGGVRLSLAAARQSA